MISDHCPGKTWDKGKLITSQSLSWLVNPFLPKSGTVIMSSTPAIEYTNPSPNPTLFTPTMAENSGPSAPMNVPKERRQAHFHEVLLYMIIGRGKPKNCSVAFWHTTLLVKWLKLFTSELISVHVHVGSTATPETF